MFSYQRQHLLNFLSPSHQVIYKKFNIACPLEVFGNFSVSADVPEDTCSAKFFTVNQEVRDQLTHKSSHLSCSFTKRSVQRAEHRCGIWSGLWVHHVEQGAAEFMCSLEINQVKFLCDLICRLHIPSPSWHLRLYVTLKYSPSTLN